jgi:hypothetical protein
MEEGLICSFTLTIPTISRKNKQTNIYLKKKVDEQNEKQFNTPRLQGKAEKTAD